MSPRSLRPALVLATWTLLVWTTRINNIWTDDELTFVAQTWRTALALVFTAFALAIVTSWWRARRAGQVDRWVPAAVRAFALWTIGVWLVRGVQIGLADHSAAFVLVHTALAVVSIGLAAWAWRRSSEASEHRTLVG